MAVELGCIKTLEQARAYIAAELPGLISIGCGNSSAAMAKATLDEIAQLQSGGYETDPNAVESMKQAILSYQNDCRFMRGLDAKPAAALNCGGGYTESALTPGNGGAAPGGAPGPGGAAPPPTSPAGMGWLGGLVLGGAALWLLFGKKKGGGKKRGRRR